VSITAISCQLIVDLLLLLIQDWSEIYPGG